MRQPKIPTAITCRQLLEKYNTPAHIILHCQKVWEVARVLGEGMLRQEYPLDMALLQASCLLHDIGKYPSILNRSKFHDLHGERILEQEGFPRVGNIVGQHVILRSKRGDPLKEEHVLFYADKRVVHDEVVSLEDRFVYLFDTYAKTPEAVDRLMVMKEDTMWLEREIFLLLDFGPEELINLVQAETVCAP
jgi:uncharacterized protein